MNLLPCDTTWHTWQGIPTLFRNWIQSYTEIQSILNMLSYAIKIEKTYNLLGR